MKTAIQQLQEKLISMGFLNIEETLNPFLEIEKNQIRRAFNVGGRDAYEQSSEDYYNETFKNE